MVSKKYIFCLNVGTAFTQTGIAALKGAQLYIVEIPVGKSTEVRVCILLRTFTRAVVHTIRQICVLQDMLTHSNFAVPSA